MPEKPDFLISAAPGIAADLQNMPAGPVKRDPIVKSVAARRGDPVTARSKVVGHEITLHPVGEHCPDSLRVIPDSIALRAELLWRENDRGLQVGV